jgi:beta-lactamase regulating signal transducer with metallopeptidase domain
MEVVLNWLWQGSVVALALLVLLRLLERASASVRYIVCWAVLLLVLALPLLSWLPAEVPPATAALGGVNAIVTVPASWWLPAMVIAAWAAWTSVSLVRFLLAIAALRRARAQLAVFPRDVAAALPHWRRIGAEGRRSSLALSDTVTTAAVLGWGRPVIAVAPSLLTSLEPDELDRVLVHEWAHVQRRDDVANLAQVVIRIVAGWHPAVWWIDRRLHLEREIACDEMAISVTGAPRSYAACLLKLTTLTGATRTTLAAPAALSASGLRARVIRIVSPRAFIAPVWSRGIGAAIVSALGGIALVVGDLKPIGDAVIALPRVAVRVASAPVKVAAPPVMTVVAPRDASAEPPRNEIATTAPASSPIEPARMDLPVAPLSITPSALPLITEPPVPVSGTELPPAAQTQVAAASQPPQVHEATVTRPAADAKTGARTPWAVATDQGTAIGRKSKHAGVATAGAFTRFARQLAGSF